MTELKTKVSGLKTPTRSGNEFTAKWKVPAKAKKNNAKDSVRFDGQDMMWVFDSVPATSGIKKGKGDEVAHDATNKDTQKTDTEKLNRKAFYPFAGKPKLAYAEFWVRGYNRQGGKRHYGPWVHSALAVKAPDKPTVALSYDAETGKLTPSYNSGGHPSTGAKECYDTQVWVWVGGDKKVDGSAWTDTAKTLTAINVPNGRSLGIGKFAKCTAQAVNRGLAGNSAAAYATRYVCCPNSPTCGEPSLVYADAAHTLSTANVVVPITGAGAVYDGETAIRAETIKLQRLKNSSTATDASSAAASENWSDVTSDDGTTVGLTDTWSAAVSDAGKYTWYRAVAIRDGYTVNGTPVQASCLNVLSSSIVVGAAVVSLSQGTDGKSMVAALSGKAAGDAGYEVTWSADADAWESTKPPDSYETTGDTLIIKGLDEGTRYYAKARAYALDSDGDHVYGEYGAMADIVPVSTPSTVALHGAESTARGNDLLLTWTYDTDAE